MDSTKINQYPLSLIFGNTSFNNSVVVHQTYYGSGAGKLLTGTYWLPKDLTSVTVLGGNVLYGAFSGCYTLTDIKLPDNLTTIEGYAFAGCTNLTNLNIPDSVNLIKDDCFKNCPNLNYYTYDNAYYLGNDSNNYKVLVKAINTSITSCIINNNTEIIYHNAFKNCNSLEYNTYNNCLYLGSSDNQYFAAIKPVDWDITSCKLKIDTVLIASDAFKFATRLTSIGIYKNVKYIGDNAFLYCYRLVEVINLSSLTFTKGATTYGNVAYYAIYLILDSGGLTYLYTQNDYIYYSQYPNVILIEYIGDSSDLTIPSNIKKINKFAFYGCSNITSVVIGDLVTEIGVSAFENCKNLNSITFGSVVKTISDYAFKGCKNLESISLPQSITTIGQYAFYQLENLREVSMEKVLAIGNYAFNGCKNLNILSFGSSLTTIGDYAFMNCYKLSSLTIPSTLKSFGTGAFSNCYSLVELYNLGTLKLTSKSTSYGSLAYYAKTIKTDSTIESSLVNVDDMIIYDDTLLVCYIGTAKNVTVKDTVTDINNYAFYESSINSISIPSSVTTINSNSFTNCYYLKEIYKSSALTFTIGKTTAGNIAYYASVINTDLLLPSLITTVDDMIIYNGNSLVKYIGTDKDVVIPNTIQTIDNYAFYNCDFIETITVPSSVTIINDYAFANCSNLINISLSTSNITSIGNYAFFNCTSLTEIIMPNTVITIKDYVFKDCKALSSITLSDILEKIGANTFYNCCNLLSLVIPSSVTTISQSAIFNCDSLTINCYSASKPSGWNTQWNFHDRPVVWNYSE